MVLPLLVAALTMAGINDDAVAANAREIQAAVVTAYFANGTQQPVLYHRKPPTQSTNSSLHIHIFTSNIRLLLRRHQHLKHDGVAQWSERQSLAGGLSLIYA